MFMRLMIFFDLPTKTVKERKVYTEFRRALLKDGYYMIQYSVYGRICNGVDSVNKYLERLKKYVPNTGSIRALSITEKQYASIYIVSGEKKREDKPVEECYQLSFF